MSTKIEWAQCTWSPITGCTHAGSPGCDMCYARRMARRLAGRYGYPEYPHHFDVTLHPDRLDVPLRRKKPTIYFVCSMSDLFHEDVPDDFIIDVFVRMGEAHQHTYQVLTKRPERMFDFITYSTWGMSPLRNVWLGVTTENQRAADERIPILLQIPAAVRFVSCEPLLEAVNLRYWLNRIWVDCEDGAKVKHLPSLGWVIAGGESGPGARPMHPDWARSLRDQCQAAGVPFFFKQHGAWLHESQFIAEEQRERGLSNKRCDARDGFQFVHIGKKAAGRSLDGRTWDEMPEVRQ